MLMCQADCTFTGLNSTSAKNSIIGFENNSKLRTLSAGHNNDGTCIDKLYKVFFAVVLKNNSISKKLFF